jgi:hypothetical protein
VGAGPKLCQKGLSVPRRRDSPPVWSVVARQVGRWRVPPFPLGLQGFRY